MVKRRGGLGGSGQRCCFIAARALNKNRVNCFEIQTFFKRSELPLHDNYELRATDGTATAYCVGSYRWLRV